MMTDSWWLKFKRAQQHMVDIRREARRYADSHPYRTIPIRQPQRYDNIQRYRLHIVQQPDPVIAIMLGDLVHNLASALDHVVVAASRPRSERKNAGFPISTENLWARDSKRRYVIRDKERRKSFLRAIRGLPPQAQALVIRAQPYQLPHRAHSSILAIISRLENADKHRELITIGTGLERPKIIVITRHERIVRSPTGLGRNQFLRDGAEIKVEVPVPVTSDPEVKMQFGGTASISIKIAHGGRNEPPSEFHLYRTMTTALATVRLILRKLEPFVIR
jgi:hypothetical protein